MKSLEEFAAGFDEEPGYLDFAKLGPLGQSVIEEERAQVELISRARFGSFASLDLQDARVRDCVADLTGFHADQVVFQPNTTTGLMHAMFGITGAVLASGAEYPAITHAAARSGEALGVLAPTWLDTEGGPVTPGIIKEHLTKKIVAVAVSLVDFRTGYLADLEGIRQVIGDRLLIVDAVQGFGVVDAPFTMADIVVSGGQKWVRAGWGTGFMAMSDRAIDRLTPVFSGYVGTDAEEMPVDEILPPTRGVRAFTIGNESPVAQARFAMALEDISSVGVPVIAGAVAERVSRVIDLADEFAVPVVSPRAEHERAGIVVLEPAADQLTVLTASLFNHGISSTTRGGRVRLSPHVSTDDDTMEMLRGALMSYATAITV